MSFIDRAKAAAEQAAEKARQGIEDVQTARDLAAAYGDLGRKAYELSSAGAISHPELQPLVQRVSELEASGGGPGATPV